MNIEKLQNDWIQIWIKYRGTDFHIYYEENITTEIEVNVYSRALVLISQMCPRYMVHKLKSATTERTVQQWILDFIENLLCTHQKEINEIMKGEILQSPPSFSSVGMIPGEMRPMGDKGDPA